MEIITLIALLVASLAFFIALTILFFGKDEESRPAPVYTRDWEYEEATRREAEYFRNHPDEWPGR